MSMSLKQLRPDGPIFFIFIHFSAKLMPNNRLRPPSGVGSPGNPGSATGKEFSTLILTPCFPIVYLHETLGLERFSKVFNLQF